MLKTLNNFVNQLSIFFLWVITGLIPYAFPLESHMEGQGSLEEFSFLCK